MNAVAEDVVSRFEPLLNAPMPKTKGLYLVDRSQNHMAAETKALDALAERAIARMMGGLKGLGLPAKTLLARMIEFGIAGAAQSGSREIEDVPADETLFWHAFNIVANTQIKKDFFFANYTSDAPMEQHARRFGWSVSNARDKLCDLRKGIIVSLKTQGMRFA